MVCVLAANNDVKAQPGAGINFNTFYDELSPYGRWVNSAEYGQVWLSNETGFEPYSTNGHWEFTNYGWMWASDYPWGWAPFHYGRWAYMPSWGWGWVPGYEWAPAWVGWCHYGGYYGWAPLGPGLGYNYSFTSIPSNYWRFVQQQYIGNRYVYRHIQRPAINANQYNNVTMINNTVVSNNNTYIAGPAQQQVERITRKRLEPKQVAFSDDNSQKTAVINKKQVRVYQPVKENSVVSNKSNEPVKQTDKSIPAREPEREGTLQPKRNPRQQQVGASQQSAPVKSREQAVDRMNPENAQQVDVENEKKQWLEKQQQQSTNRGPAAMQPNQQKQERIWQQQRQNEIRQQQIQTEQQEMIRRRQQNQAGEQATLRKEQIYEERQQELRRQQQQQQNEWRRQEQIRQQEQVKQQRQNEMRPQKIQPQQNWNEPSVQRQPSQPARPNKNRLQ